MIGDARVTVILDSFVDFPFELLIGASPEESKELHDQSLRGPTAFVTVNCFLVESGSATILIDAGIGGTPDAASGRLPKELENLGLRPEDISHVCLTHLHADHAGGIVSMAGQSAFPHAEYVAHREEKACWFGSRPPANNTHLLQQYEFAQTIRPFMQQFKWVGAGPLMPGIEMVHLPGHTPGHSGYRITSNNQCLFIWGDVVHQPHLQIPRPDIGVAFDFDPDLAAESRRRALRESEANCEIIGGMHTDFPALGRIRGNDRDGFCFVPHVWSPAVSPLAQVLK
jgi:glyoxylase-like metal-dependent hydrolase (beta-lactamase superfamily II)